MTKYYTDSFATSGSESIEKIFYDDRTSTLYVKFVSGETVYAYSHVDVSRYTEMRKDYAEGGSVGLYWRTSIKGKFTSTKIDSLAELVKRYESVSVYSSLPVNLPVFTIVAEVTTEFRVSGSNLQAALTKFLFDNPGAVVKSVKA